MEWVKPNCSRHDRKVKHGHTWAPNLFVIYLANCTKAMVNYGCWLRCCAACGLPIVAMQCKELSEVACRLMFLWPGIFFHLRITCWDVESSIILWQYFNYDVPFRPSRWNNNITLNIKIFLLNLSSLWSPLHIMYISLYLFTVIFNKFKSWACSQGRTVVLSHGHVLCICPMFTLKKCGHSCSRLLLVESLILTIHTFTHTPVPPTRTGDRGQLRKPAGGVLWGGEGRREREPLHPEEEEEGGEGMVFCHHRGVHIQSH